MSPSKDNNLKNCFSRLREFIDEEPQGTGKGIALLVLRELQAITAGTGPDTAFTCSGRPRAYAETTHAVG